VFAGRFALGAMQFDGTATRAVCVCASVCHEDINVATCRTYTVLVHTYTYVYTYKKQLTLI
jgi:hypothetical protein